MNCDKRVLLSSDDRLSQIYTNNIHIVELNYFGELGKFENSFVQNEFVNWLDYIKSSDHDRAKYVEDRLSNIPFEQAYRCKNPEFYLESNSSLLTHVFNEQADWRHNPESIRNLSNELQQKIYRNFEYMLYYVINTRDELEFDLKDAMNIKCY
jgi:hypothetical protein